MHNCYVLRMRRNSEVYYRGGKAATRTSHVFGAPLLIALAIMLCILPLQDGSQPDRSTGQTVKSLKGGDAWGGSPAAKVASKSLTSGASVIRGQVSYVYDGDTLQLAGVAVRLSNLDCAETGSAAGKAATVRLRHLVRFTTISCDLTGQKSYDRYLGRCALSDGRDIASVLVAEGYCRYWS